MHRLPRHHVSALLLGLVVNPLAPRIAAQLAPSAVLLPSGIAFDATGNLYFSDANRHQVLEATLGGQLLLIAGSGIQGFSGDGGPATAAQLNSPQALAFGPDGTLYIADTGNHRIRAIAPASNASPALITTLAGTGTAGFSGDNGAPAAAALNMPNALALDASGALLVCDSANHRLRRITSPSAPASALITTLAGTGTQGFSGDDGPATLAHLDTPSGVAVAPDGRIFLADAHNQRVRVISTAGILTTLAGTGTAGFSGDDGPATAARLASPRGLTFTASGNLLIVDADNQRLRSVSPAGIITTLAGSATQGTAADATPALTAALNTPLAAAVSSFGYPAFTDAANRTLRLLAADGTLYLPAALTSGRASTLTLTATPSSATITVQGAIGTPQGSVQLFNGASPLASAALTAGSATLTLPTLTSGTYSLTAVYAGDLLNPAATSPTLTLTPSSPVTTTTTVGSRATPIVAAQTPAQTDYATLPVPLSATVAPLASATATPTGSVSFLDGTTPIATASLVAGTASASFLQPSAGLHTVTAAYSGDATFAPATSPALSVLVVPLPDFSLTTSGSTTQTVASGLTATYTLALAPVNGPFTGAVALAVAGLPSGATAGFQPPQIVPGNTASTITLSVQTLAVPVVQLHRSRLPLYALVLLLPPLTLRRRRLRALAFAALLPLSACGTRINEPTVGTSSYPLSVTATGTNLAGSVVTHTATLTLTVQ